MNGQIRYTQIIYTRTYLTDDNKINIIKLKVTMMNIILTIH